MLYLLLLIINLFYGCLSNSLLFSNLRDIRSVNINQTRVNSTIVINQLNLSSALDFYYNEQIIFWTESEKRKIIGLKLDQNPDKRKRFDIITTGHYPEGLACDWVTKKLYWTNLRRIEVSNFNGTNWKVLFWEDLDSPRAICLLPQRGFMFWTDWGNVPKIERASMNGKNRKVIVDKHISWPNGLTIDYESERIYFADAKIKYIASVDYDGKSKRILFRSVPHIYSLASDAEMIYFTEWTNHGISSCNKTNGQCRLLISNQKQGVNDLNPITIRVFSASRQPEVKTECNNNNGGCSHLCLISSEFPYYSCACPTGVLIGKDNKTCSDGPKKLLIFTRKIDIRRISLDTDDYNDVVLKLKGIKNANSIDIDPIEGKIYWTDDKVKAIRRAYHNSSKWEEVISDDLAAPDGICVDWVARNLYWTDSKTDTIQVSRLDGSKRKTLISNDLDEPRAIVVHPVAGLMFWSDWGAYPKIERASLDGSERIILIKTGLTWPNGLAIDFETNKLYWGDAKLDRIEYCNFDGKGRIVLLSKVRHPFGLTLLDDYVYWTDWYERMINRVNKTTGLGKQVIIEHLPDMMGIKAISLERSPAYNLCVNNNGNCTHLCFNTPHGIRCSCANYYKLNSDGKTCDEDPLETYTPLLKRIKMTKAPRSSSLIINKPCLPHQFKCSDGRCIQEIDICNGFSECSDNSDERDCPKCIQGEYPCEDDGTVRCLPLTSICDPRNYCKEKFTSLCENHLTTATESDDKHLTYLWIAAFLYLVISFILLSYRQRTYSSEKEPEENSESNRLMIPSPEVKPYRLYVPSSVKTKYTSLQMSTMYKCKSHNYIPSIPSASSILPHHSHQNHHASHSSLQSVSLREPFVKSKRRTKKHSYIQAPPPTPDSSHNCTDVIHDCGFHPPPPTPISHSTSFNCSL